MERRRPAARDPFQWRRVADGGAGTELGLLDFAPAQLELRAAAGGAAFQLGHFCTSKLACVVNPSRDN